MTAVRCQNYCFFVEHFSILELYIDGAAFDIQGKASISNIKAHWVPAKHKIRKYMEILDYVHNQNYCYHDSVQ